MSVPPSSQLLLQPGLRAPRIPLRLWIGFRLVVTLAILAAAATGAGAQPQQPRLVVFEGFYRPT
jgi:hypothetical protein